ncbi:MULTISPECIES: rhodanese-like domain-containing protein [Sporolactobacillus]|uniref:Rhodanese-related sulfurtransferase n=1 Tax=Sporolactobacillus nakayamae TaxID=269670 RepID=A0A1I2WG07_9BACL|nr:rhodanese-like domain-containing protein [Sporolactobacillus nakayamae]SFG98521.1 Rhodanese-related sulfurtransferase [Sporolactobacillus nakayamae]
MYKDVSADEVKRMRLNGQVASVIDVREPDEFAEGHIPGAVNISVNSIQSQLRRIDKSKEHILVCHAGVRSAFAAEILSASGFQVKNMTGGMLAWTGAITYS